MLRFIIALLLTVLTTTLMSTNQVMAGTPPDFGISSPELAAAILHNSFPGGAVPTPSSNEWPLVQKLFQDLKTVSGAQFAGEPEITLSLNAPVVWSGQTDDPSLWARSFEADLKGTLTRKMFCANYSVHVIGRIVFDHHTGKRVFDLSSYSNSTENWAQCV